MNFSWLSTDICLFTLAAISVSILGQLLWKKSKEKSLPPGPKGVPLLGHLPFMWRAPLQTFMKWKEEYGSVFTVLMGGKRIIVLNDIDSMKEFFSHEEMVGCFNVAFMDIFMEYRGGPGVALAEGENWRELRGFVMKSFSNFGIKDKKFEENLISECEQMVEDLSKSRGHALELRKIFPRYVVNTFWGSIGDKKLNEKEIQLLMHTMKAHTHCETILEVIACLFPRIARKFSSILTWRFDAFVSLKEMIDSKTGKHLESRIPQHPRDIIDGFQDTCEITTNPESSFHKSRAQLTPLLIDLLFGAVETTSLTLEWLILYALKNPEIQLKIQEEIDEVIGADRKPQLSDRANMPFTEACIIEALRIRPAVPFAIPKRVTQDSWVRGYFIPKNATVMANVRGVHSNAKTWDKPEEFLPLRFLDEQGSLLPDARKMIVAFGRGKRSCPGERLAYEELFMFVTNLFQNFTVTSEYNNPSTEVAFGLVTIPLVLTSASFASRRLK